MDVNRTRELELNCELLLTRQELEEGWHRCPDWDYMVVGPGDEEMEACLCRITPKIPDP